MEIINKLNSSLDNIVSGLFGSLGTGLAAILIIIIGWYFANFIKKMVKKLIDKTGIDQAIEGNKVNLSELISKFIYFLAMIFVLILALEKLGMTSVLEPIKNLLNEFTKSLDNIVKAGIVGYVGYMIAKIVSELIGLSGDTIQKFTHNKLKIPNDIDLVNILKKIVFIVIFIPVLIQALQFLNMQAISEPATQMLAIILTAFPKIILAIIILGISILLAKFVSNLSKDLLDSFNLNELLKKAGLNSIIGKVNIEKLIGNIIYIFIVLFGTLSAFEKLNFMQLTNIVNTVVELGGNIFFGLIIFAIGNWISILASKSYSKNNEFVGAVVRSAILSVFLAIGLSKMGIAENIINMAFGITFGTIALTVILSFGLGGRAAAGEQMKKILDKFNK